MLKSITNTALSNKKKETRENQTFPSVHGAANKGPIKKRLDEPSLRAHKKKGPVHCRRGYVAERKGIYIYMAPMRDAIIRRW